ncbi:hypothetical protein ACLOJK_004555 [Asimina triloba]
MAGIAGIEQAVATSVDGLEAARADEMCDGDRDRRTRCHGWCRWMQADGEDDVLAMIIMMGGLDCSIQAPVMASCSVVGISGQKWLTQRAAGKHRDVGSGVQASVGASAARCRRAWAVDGNSMGGLDRPIQALPAKKNEGSSIWGRTTVWMRLRRKCLVSCL